MLTSGTNHTGLVVTGISGDPITLGAPKVTPQPHPARWGGTPPGAPTYTFDDPDLPDGTIAASGAVTLA